MKMRVSSKGFTLVELLIVVIVIGILAAITVVAYQGMQIRARNAQRVQDVKVIAKAIELYYIDNGTFPNSICNLGAGCRINGSWNSTSDASWSNLESQLVPTYMSKLPQDPLASTANNAGIFGGYNYDYIRSGGWCQSPGPRPAFMLAYRLEGSGSQNRELIGDCGAGTVPTDYSSSEYFVVK